LIAIDTSALVALFLREPDYETITDIIDEADAAFISVATRLELVAVLCGKRVGADPKQVGDYIDGLNLEHVSVSAEQMHLAIGALLRFGKGRHPARLNLGDCFVYALAKSLGAPLLFKGEDFAKTDLVPAWPPSA
jgi:ribonuclease VapC